MIGNWRICLVNTAESEKSPLSWINELEEAEDSVLLLWSMKKMPLKLEMILTVKLLMTEQLELIIASLKGHTVQLQVDTMEEKIKGVNEMIGEIVIEIEGEVGVQETGGIDVEVAAEVLAIEDETADDQEAHQDTEDKTTKILQ